MGNVGSGKRILITGASGGIGKVMASLFGRQGAVVGVHNVSNRSVALSVAEEIRQVGGESEIFVCDLVDRTQCEQLVSDFVDRFGGIDVLVNNAGAAGPYRDFREIGEHDWERAMALNARAPFMLSRNAWPHMIENGWGRIINISSAAVEYGGSPKSIHYIASKAALEGITVALAKAGAPVNILVNAIRPGIIATGMAKRVPGYSEERYRQRVAMVPMGRAGTSEEVARMVVFLASEGGDYITGQVITIGGGD